MPREYLSNVLDVEPSKVKPPNSQDKVLETIIAAPDGMTVHEIYVALPNIRPRQVRLSLQDLKIKGQVTYDVKCRCNCSSIYYGVKE